MKISIVIPNYNGAELLEKNIPKVLESIGNNNDLEKEIIIIDDDSIDNSIEIMGKIFEHWKSSHIKLVLSKNEKNLGFATTVNKGVGKAEGEIVILLNTDVIPHEDFLKPLLKHFDNPEIFAVGCMDKSIENGKTILRGRGIGKWTKGFLIHAKGEVDKTNTLWVNGGSGAFKKSIWEKLGGFNEIYNPFYWEDIDLSYRALKSGYKIIFEPKSIVIHEHEKGSIKKKYSNSQIKAIVYRNQFIFVWGNLTDLDLQLIHFFWLPYHLIKALFNQDWMFFVGFFRALILIPKIIKFNLKSKKIFIKKDSEVIKDFQK